MELDKKVSELANKALSAIAEIGGIVAKAERSSALSGMGATCRFIQGTCDNLEETYSNKILMETQKSAFGKALTELPQELEDRVEVAEVIVTAGNAIRSMILRGDERDRELTREAVYAIEEIEKIVRNCKEKSKLENMGIMPICGKIDKACSQLAKFADERSEVLLEKEEEALDKELKRLSAEKASRKGDVQERLYKKIDMASGRLAETSEKRFDFDALPAKEIKAFEQEIDKLRAKGFSESEIREHLKGEIIYFLVHGLKGSSDYVENDISKEDGWKDADLNEEMADWIVAAKQLLKLTGHCGDPNIPLQIIFNSLEKFSIHNSKSTIYNSSISAIVSRSIERMIPIHKINESTEKLYREQLEEIFEKVSRTEPIVVDNVRLMQKADAKGFVLPKMNPKLEKEQANVQ